MFNQKHYIPILKWKSAEQQAIVKLSPEEKKFVTPLIQIIMPALKALKAGEKEKTPEEQREELVASFKTKMLAIPEEILTSWGNDHAFIDLSLVPIASLRNEGIEQIITSGDVLGLSLIPVINLSSDDEAKGVVFSLAKKYKKGLCLRLVCSDFEDISKLNSSLEEFVKKSGLSEKEVDLLVDLKEKKEDYDKIITLTQSITNLLDWRTFMFASGAFPVDLSEYKVGRTDIDRTDWNNWSNQIKSGKLKRAPSFADYTIQHPIYKEAAGFFSPSASLRYTLNDKWLIMRGRKGNAAQYLANAQLLSKLPEFFGEKFSFGDAQINEKGKDINSPKTGNAKTWLVATINHHLACTVDQVAKLS